MDRERELGHGYRVLKRGQLASRGWLQYRIPSNLYVNIFLLIWMSDSVLSVFAQSEGTRDILINLKTLQYNRTKAISNSLFLLNLLIQEKENNQSIVENKVVKIYSVGIIELGENDIQSNRPTLCEQNYPAKKIIKTEAIMFVHTL